MCSDVMSRWKISDTRLTLAFPVSIVAVSGLDQSCENFVRYVNVKDNEKEWNIVYKYYVYTHLVI